MSKNEFSPNYIVVLDTSAVLNMVDLQKLLPKNSEVWLPEAVFQEIISMEGRAKLAVINEILTPTQVSTEQKWIEKTRKIAKNIGINSRLSKVDIEVLAICLQTKTMEPSKKLLLLTDDRWMQNFAIQTNIPVRNIRFRKARKMKRWIFQCTSCKKEFAEGDQPDCPVCGGSLQPKRIASS